MPDLEQQIVELETRLAYFEDLLQSLNNTVYSQDQKLVRLETENQQLLESLKELMGSFEGGEDAPPPHY